MLNLQHSVLHSPDISESLMHPIIEFFVVITYLQFSFEDTAAGSKGVASTSSSSLSLLSTFIIISSTCAAFFISLLK